jgi:hypothetical protein
MPHPPRHPPPNGQKPQNPAINPTDRTDNEILLPLILNGFSA